MALLPPSDFAPPRCYRSRPSDRELHELWERHEARRHERERKAEWRRVVEGVRRGSDGILRASQLGGQLPDYLCDRAAFGSHARGALRSAPRQGRVVAAGVDTWSPCWYAPPGSPLARAMRSLATLRTRVASLLPDSVDGYRIGWFPDVGLVFAEGKPCGGKLVAASDLPVAMQVLCSSLRDLGLPVGGVRSGGLRRIDVAVDMWMDSSAEGLALLECVSSSALGRGKLVAYRSERCVESVLIKTRAGRTRGRLYDKGAQTSTTSRGRWIRFEAQWRFPRGTRPALEQLDVDALRDRFWQRFQPLWQAAGGFRFGGVGAVGDRLEAAVRSGQLLPSRARSIAGYLLLSAAGVAQGARRTEYELERECRQLGLSVSLLQDVDRYVDVAKVLEECVVSEIWQ